MEREKSSSAASSTERFVSKLARQTRSENSRKRDPNETPLPHPQVNGGLGLGYMATSHAYLIPFALGTETLIGRKFQRGLGTRECHDVLS
jgi:hypothetical protein